MEAKKESTERPALTEDKAELLLEELLDKPGYAFLSQHPKNLYLINNADSAVEALSIARKLIEKRVEASIIFDSIENDDGFSKIKANAKGIIRTLESIQTNQQLIGEGMDAVVVIDKNEVKEFPPEVCYKFSKIEKTPRGRNSIGQEAYVQQKFYDVLEMSGSNIGVPEPFYALDTGNEKMFAMERLPAVSIDEINRGLKKLPSWVDIDTLCDELEAVIDLLHHSSLYHRDLHPGNIMIPTKAPVNESEKIGYIIDFGLSGYGDEIDPYRRTTAEGVFTYNDDRVMIKTVRTILKKVEELYKEGYGDDN